MERIIEIVNERAGEVGSAGSKEFSLIDKAEAALGVHFPKSYREFLNKWGVFWFEGLEYYGVIDDDFENAGIPDVVWVNRQLRASEDFPNNLIVFSNRDGVQYWCMDTSAMNSNNECPIVLWDNVRKKVAESFDISFTDFVVDELEAAFELA